jgi:hypothetical protein
MEIFMSGEIDGEISDIFRELQNEIEDRIKILELNDYGNEVESLGIIPIIVNLTPELEVAGFFKERKLFKRKAKDADIRLRINFEKFANSDRYTQKLLLIKNTIESVRVLGGKANKDFDSIRLENDILNLFEIEKAVIEKINTQ